MKMRGLFSGVAGADSAVVTICRAEAEQAERIATATQRKGRGTQLRLKNLSRLFMGGGGVGRLRGCQVELRAEGRKSRA